MSGKAILAGNDSHRKVEMTKKYWWANWEFGLGGRILEIKMREAGRFVSINHVIWNDFYCTLDQRQWHIYLHKDTQKYSVFSLVCAEDSPEHGKHNLQFEMSQLPLQRSLLSVKNYFKRSGEMAQDWMLFQSVRVWFSATHSSWQWLVTPVPGDPRSSYGLGAHRHT